MPKERQDTCSNDYITAAFSWEKALKPHLRAPNQPRQKIEVAYGPVADYAIYAQALRTIGLMEMLADYAADRFSWRRPITFVLARRSDAGLCLPVGCHLDQMVPELCIVRA